jgi:flagellar hook-associated protein 3 FlgL
MASGVSTLGQYLDQISRLKGQQSSLGELSVQISSGKKTQKLSGLGNDIIRATRARAGVDSLETYSNNITNAQRRIKLMLNSTSEIKAQVEKITAGLQQAVQEGDYPDLESIKQLTGNVYNFILDNINQTDGERYLFGGGDTTQKPISDNGLYASALGNFIPDSSDLTNPPLVSSGVIGDWGDGTITTAQFMASYNGTNDTVLGFSNALTSNTAGKTTVRVSDESEFDYTVLANKTAMKDIVKLLGVLKALPPVEYAPGALNNPAATTIAEDTPPNPPAAKQEAFFAVLTDISTRLNKALDQMDQVDFKLSQVQAQIDTVNQSHTTQINAYKDIIGETEDVDITEASAKILQIQTQLQASFQVTALMSQLTLANYLN